MTNKTRRVFIMLSRTETVPAKVIRAFGCGNAFAVFVQRKSLQRSRADVDSYVNLAHFDAISSIALQMKSIASRSAMSGGLKRTAGRQFCL